MVVKTNHTASLPLRMVAPEARGSIAASAVLPAVTTRSTMLATTKSVLSARRRWAASRISTGVVMARRRQRRMLRTMRRNLNHG